ncbi:MAG: 2,3-bisphosphoglycerate-independent phosphoglycerate mutase [Verrucomicrobia bacterium]|nr:MAG: 2,3-bisphosphoglycerate-independent phosphoglycerate mutase [Verrucomicrobiota bacterium]PYK51976.1 MAG: 2,3-bisphosphoglycerate-independent phosphoglycerate mutase [Verrucomicrobiota bacterium]
MSGPVMLIIRDGWGINPGGCDKRNENGDATLLASTPFHDKLYRDYPCSRLSASGVDVGLPEGQMGNSEVGHLNLGAGRIVYQDLTRINKAIEEGELMRNPVLQETFAAARGHRLHLLGLVSDGGVHSHYSHMIALANAAREAGVMDIFVHAFTDGRDTSPTGGSGFLRTCEKELKKSGAEIVTVVGRYFAMDRDRRWDRTKKAWDAIVLGRGEVCKSSPSAAVERQYSVRKTDEFMPPLIFSYANEQRVRDGDSVLFFNFRADRARQLSQAFLLKDFDGFDREVWPQVHFISLTQYDVRFPSPFIFPQQELRKILAEVVSAAGKSQLRIAETEKYAHVTYFFNGGIEKPFPGEDRKLIPSPKVATYDLKPEMSAIEVTDEVLARMANYDLIILNFANPDMVGHTGVVEAGIKAVETVDECIARIIPKLLELGGKCLITADHGNCEQMRNPDGSPNTAHTSNLVHFIYVAKDAAKFRCEDGILADVAPTLLFLLGLPQPKAMTGHNLLVPIFQKSATG